ncbi:MAG: hypothetical protein ABIH87_03740 [bacterium]
MSKTVKYMIIGLIIAAATLLVGFLNWQYPKVNESGHTPTQAIENTNSPGSIATVGQIGDNNIVNQQKQRSLDEIFIQRLDNMLPKDKSKGVKLYYATGNPEAENFAKQIKDYLILEGWTVDPYISQLSSNNSSGLYIDVRDEIVNIEVMAAAL